MSKGHPTLSLEAAPLSAPLMRETLAEREFTFEETSHAFWRARGTGCTVTFYQKGKVVLQGPDALAVAALLGLEGELPKGPLERFEEALALHPTPPPEAWLGSDETGKGDYFGPLVVVAFRLERSHVPLAAELGAADSKRLSDAKVSAIAPELARLGEFATVQIGPRAYNRLYAKMGNLNHLLAWAHSRAIQDLLAKAPVDYGVVDRFAEPRLITSRMTRAECTIRLDQRPRAEDDPAVAIASILARREFLHSLAKLSREAGFKLPKGAGPPVIAAGRRIIDEHGREALERFAKLHFTTTRSLG